MAFIKQPLLDGELDKILGQMSAAPQVEAMGFSLAASRDLITFENHPLYRQLLFKRSVGFKLRLQDPHHRVHDGAAGATTSIHGVERINFASYDYLNLNRDPRIQDAVEQAGRIFGTSVSASRMTAGERWVHGALEGALARVYEAEAALAFVSGHGGIVSTLATLMGPRDLILYDAFSHNCIVLGAKLSGAARRSYPHNNINVIEDILTVERDRFERVLIVCEGLFSMDGDGPDLPQLIALKKRHAAILMVDDAHGLGVLGARGRGIFEHQGVNPGDVDIWVGTLSKALVSCGGYVAGSGVVVDLLKHHAPGFVYSVGLPAGAAVAATTALDIMLSEPERVGALQARSRQFHDRLRSRGINIGASWGYGILPVIVGDPLRAVELSQRLFLRNINTFPVLPPGVPEGSARIRFFISAAHAEEQIDQAVEILAEEMSAMCGLPLASRE